MCRLLLRWLSLILVVVPFAPGTTFAAEQGSEFTGVVTAMPAGGLVGDWTIGDRRLRTDTTTTFRQEHGRLAVGVTASVRTVKTTAGTLLATRITFVHGSTDDSSAGADDRSGNSSSGNSSSGNSSSGNASSGDSSSDGAPGSGHGGSDDGANHDANDLGELRGAIEALPVSGLTGQWRVAGRAVMVVQATSIDQEHGAAVVGATVEIHGTPDSSGALIASDIEVVASSSAPVPVPAGARIEILGTIGALPASGFVGTWTVADRPIVVTATTLLDSEHGTFEVGRTVEVNATKQADSSLVALRIEAKRGQGAPVASAHFWGRVDALPTTGTVGLWRVGDKLVDVSATTVIDTTRSPIALQAIVEVEGWVQSDAVIAAKSIATRTSEGVVSGQSTRAVEYRHARTGRFFVTASAAEIAALDNGAFNGDWQRTGEGFNVGGDRAACRFYGMPPRGPDSHFFTVDASECAIVMGDMPAWTFEGFAFAITAPQGDGQCAAGEDPVHRLYNQATRMEDMNHRYVTSANAVAATIALGYVDEGVVMCAQP